MEFLADEKRTVTIAGDKAKHLVESTVMSSPSKVETGQSSEGDRRELLLDVLHILSK